MLKRALFSVTRSGLTVRSIAGGSDGKGPKDPSAKDVLGKDLLDAVDNVVNDLHGTDPDAKKSSKSTLLSKLISHEKDTFSAATAAQTSEMLDDKSLLNLLDFVAASNKAMERPPPPTLGRKEKQGLVALRKEIFCQARLDGYSATEAQQIAENAVETAKGRVAKQREAQNEGREAEDAAERAAAAKRDEKEESLYRLAYEMADKMLYQEELARAASKVKILIKPDPGLGSLLKTEQRLGIFTTLEGTKQENLSFWDDWDLRATRIMNQSLGPANAIEEHIEWTEKGKQWPYPINNEYLLGEEENVSFIEHIFLERHLPALGIPKSGPIAHFMHLVCVGLSKNPYMTAAKKMEHLRWFANYFNEEKQKVVHRLHEEEQAAASQNA